MTTATIPRYTTNQVEPVSDPIPASGFLIPRGNPPRRLTIAFTAPSAGASRSVLEYVTDRLNELLALPPDWDGDGAQPVASEAAAAAVRFLGGIVTVDSIPPQTFPLPSGGVQLEWWIGGRDLELTFTPSGQVSVLGTDSDGDVHLERDAEDFAGAHALVVEVRDYLRSISAPLRAGR